MKSIHQVFSGTRLNADMLSTKANVCFWGTNKQLGPFVLLFGRIQFHNCFLILPGGFIKSSQDPESPDALLSLPTPKPSKSRTRAVALCHWYLTGVYGWWFYCRTKRKMIFRRWQWQKEAIIPRRRYSSALWRLEKGCCLVGGLAGGEKETRVSHNTHTYAHKRFKVFGTLKETPCGL